MLLPYPGLAGLFHQVTANKRKQHKKSGAIMLGYFAPLLKDKVFTDKHPELLFWAADTYYRPGEQSASPGPQ